MSEDKKACHRSWFDLNVLLLLTLIKDKNYIPLKAQVSHIADVRSYNYDFQKYKYFCTPQNKFSMFYQKNASQSYYFIDSSKSRKLL